MEFLNHIIMAVLVIGGFFAACLGIALFLKAWDSFKEGVAEAIGFVFNAVASLFD